MSSHVPFVDLYSQYLSLRTEIDAAIQDVISRSSFIRGPHVDHFEKAFSQLLGASHCISCANGTDALYIAMTSLGVRPGDEVLVPAHSWISTAETVTQAGASVVFCDTDTDTYTISPKSIEEKITPSTVGIIPVHLYGQPADMDRIMSIAARHNLWVLEDCAQAHLSRYKGQYVGTFGNAASFSFYPGKNLGAMGDAGALITNDAALAETMTMFARHGGLKKGDHQIEGINSRMDGLQAAVLTVKLPHLHKWTALRQQHALQYSQLLSDLDSLQIPQCAKHREHVWHLYVIQTERRDLLKSHLAEVGVQTVINYPVALPFLPAYKRLNHTPEEFPNAFFNQSRIISLPIYPELTNEQLEYVTQAIHTFAAAQ